jgi:RecB family exonuclease
MPPPAGVVFARERDDIRRDLSLFLDAEEKAAARGVTPVGFEVAFGTRDSGDEEPLGQADPVELRLPGARFLLNGRIDRIDRLPGGAYQVVDYKTGSLYWPAYRKVFRHGRLLQHALYAVAAESLLRASIDPTARVRSGRYAFVTAKGAGRSRVIERPPDSDLGRVLAALLDIAGAGAFMARADTRDRRTCEFCDFSDLCGGPSAVTRAEAKLGNAANKALDPYRRLLEEDNA